MTLLELFTWMAIGVLVVGSSLVFGWFIVEVGRGWRGRRAAGRAAPPPPP